MQTSVRARHNYLHQIFNRMQYVTENITPAKAQQYLATSRGNRPESKVTVLSYADTMKKGKWLLNGMCIIFDNEGHLIDGHTRMMAVIEAGVPVRFDVCRGASPDAFTTYDNGRHRTVGQLLAMQDVKHYNLVGAIVSANEQLKKNGRLVANNRGIRENGLKRTNAEMYDTYRQDAEGFNAVAVIIVRLLSRCRILNGSWAGGLYYYLTHTGGYKEEEVLPFFEALFSLDTTEVPVADMLRKSITKAAISGQKLEAETLWVYIVKSWNHYISGTTPKFLRYQKENEDIPKLILK